MSVLDEDSLGVAAGRLAAKDPRLGRLIERNGIPPLWRRDPGFATMVRLILEQQVSLASAAAAFERLEQTIETVSPQPFITLDDDELRRIGFSRQKAGYARGLAARIEVGDVDFEALGQLDDGAARSTLLGIRGVGPWTADCYLLFALSRPDVWPPGDRALLVSLGRALGRDDVPDSDEAVEIADAWRPLRAVAARLLWHDYLGGRE